jgi:alkylhydroperoxidase family enzyme
MAIAWGAMPVDADPRRVIAPEVAEGIDRLEASIWDVADPHLVELARRRIALLLGNTRELDSPPPQAPALPQRQVAELASWPTSDAFDARERGALSFAEQFVIDVDGISDDDRAALAEAIGADAVGGYVQALYVLDQGQRGRMALERLFGAGEVPTP